MADAAVWTEPGSPAYQRIAVALFLAGFATFSLLYCVQPLLPLFTHTFSISATESSLALSLATGAVAFSIVTAGIASQSIGRRGLMFASMCLAALLNVAAAHVDGWHLLLVARTLEGIALGGVPAVAMAYLSEEIHPRGLGYAMGLYVAGTAFGGMAGRVGVGLLAEYTSWQTAMTVLGMLCLAAAVGFVWLLPASRNFERRTSVGPRFHLQAFAAHWQTKGLPRVFLVGFLVMGAFVTVYNYAGFRLQSPPWALGQAAVSLIFTAYLFGMVSSSTAGAVADRVGRGVVLMSGIVVAGSGIALTLSARLPVFVAGIVLLTIGFFVAHSVASGWVGRLALASKGHASSLYLLAYYLGSSVAGSVGGWFWTHGGWPAVAAFSGGLLLAALSAAVSLWRAASGDAAL